MNACVHGVCFAVSFGYKGGCSFGVASREDAGGTSEGVYLEWPQQLFTGLCPFCKQTTGIGLVWDPEANLDTQWSKLSLLPAQGLAEVCLFIVDTQQSLGQGSHPEVNGSDSLGICTHVQCGTERHTSMAERWLLED